MRGRSDATEEGHLANEDGVGVEICIEQGRGVDVIHIDGRTVCRERRVISMVIVHVEAARRCSETEVYYQSAESAAHKTYMHRDRTVTVI